MKNYPIINLIFLLLLCYNVSAQNKQTTGKVKKQLKEAETYLKLEEYHFVEEEMMDAVKIAPSDSLCQYYLGIAVFNSPTKNRVDALSHFELTYEKDNNFRQINYWLGKNYQLLHEFKKAEAFYEKEKALFTSLSEDQLKEKKKFPGYVDYSIAELDRYIDQCKRGYSFMAEVDDKLLLNLSLANTYLPDITPIITVDGQRLYFTSHRQDISSHHELDPHDQLPYQDVFYMDRREDGFWGTPKEFKEINTDEHDAAIALSSDGKQLFLYRSVGASTNNPGDIYEVHNNNGTWTEPQPVSAPINSGAMETHMSMSSDGNVIIFTSNREGEGSQGMQDLYIIRKLPNGEWAMPQNMGNKINTSLNEESPYIHPNGKTLYFSSQGHNSIGGYDVFRVDIDLKSGTLGELEQLKYPVNSASDDLFYVMSSDGSESYFSSVREEGMGGYDIYCVKNNEHNRRKVLFLTTQVNTSDHRKVKATVKLINIKTQEVEKEEVILSQDGKIEWMHRCAGDYGIEITAEDYMFKSDRIDFDTFKEPTVTLDITYDLQRFDLNKSEPLFNVYFDDSEINMSTSRSELNAFKEFTDKYPDYSFEIVGHSDFDDSKSKLVQEFESKTKTMETLEALSTLGMSSENLVSENIGYGSKFPLYIASSFTHWKNNRMEYIIRPKGYKKIVSRASDCSAVSYDQASYDFVNDHESVLASLLSELKQCAYLELVVTHDGTQDGLDRANEILKYFEDNGINREQLSTKIKVGSNATVNLRYIQDQVAEDGYVNYDPNHDNEEVASATTKSTEDLAFESRIENLTIQFPFGSESFDAKENEILKEIKDYLILNSNKSLQITGHTDSTGPEVYNDYLGLQRAKSIAFFFKDIENPNRITVKSKGEMEPIASNATREGRYENRRIQFKFNVK
ncbi:hypothetical protein EI427_20250 [Flammeovirga pectinis]|uniref:OmpA-like domain-containing protein n=1 Tax=Flammeovirga pectinis TaxID=2494373 RepID=A0A3Q9FTS4_9BACT|nr:OmpA family protein [Flammeovirga pectinis]AZQ64456.1 hypothetical protein EI427_20250 [Flammeovirga pectinis]